MKTRPRPRLALAVLAVLAWTSHGPSSAAAPPPVSRAAVGSTATRPAPSRAPSPAQIPEPLAALIHENRHVVTESHERLGGAGLDFLVDEAAAAEFLMIGESHQMVEIPRLTERLIRELRPHGYGALAVETGPLVTEAVVESIGRDGVAAFARTVARYPFTLPFLEHRPEAEMIASALEAGYEVWGLDQEFVGSGRYWLDRLDELAPDDAARQLIAAWQRRELAGARHFRQSGSTEELLLLVASPEDFAAMRDAFARTQQALEIIEELERSAEIYQLWRTANYRNNLLRVETMKRNLVDRLRTWKASGRAAPKVLMKFGSVHGVRGRTSVNQFDLGNLIQELAFVRGGRSLHVWTTALGLRSADGDFTPWGSDEPGWRMIYDGVAPEAAWTIFDLRPLRPWFHRDANREGNEALARTVFQYDLVALAPEFHPSERLAGR